MFCRKCGRQLEDNAKFCSGCGERVIVENEESSGFERKAQTDGNHEKATGKSNGKEYLTIENIERFAPAAALVPLAMAVVSRILHLILFSRLFYIPSRWTIYSILFTVFKILFIGTTAGATAGLIYVAVNSKDLSRVNTWVAPFATLLATVSCLGMAYGWGIIAWIAGIIAVVLGLEFVPRIVIEQQPMDSPVNPQAAIETYKRYFTDYKAKYPTTKELERAGIADPENSEFDGAGIELFGYTLLSILVCAVTCGLAAPWMICKMNSWKASHTVINGKRLTFTGSGASLFGHWILWEILTIITCGIYGFFVHVALRKWELSHTYIAGEPVFANSNVSYFDGGSLEYLGYGLLSGLLLIVTCGLSYPWVMVMLQKWDTRHQVINQRRLVFSGSGLGFLGEFLIILILSTITCGIYAPWGTVRLNKYITRHTDFVDANSTSIVTL